MKAIKLFLALFVLVGVAIAGCDSSGNGKKTEVIMLEPVDEQAYYETTDGTGGVSITFTWTVENIKEGFIPVICFDRGFNPYDGGVQFSKILESNATSFTYFFPNGYWRGNIQWGVIVNEKHIGQIFSFKIITPEKDFYGCTDKLATNYNSDATVDDGTCKYYVPGCIDETAVNYNPDATVGDGSCIYLIPGCMDETAKNYDPIATIDDGTCEYDILGCTDELAENYDPTATADDGTCEYSVPGCMDETAINYNPEATISDGSCEYPIPGCTNKNAVNYDPTATVDDGSCQFREVILLEPVKGKVFYGSRSITFRWEVKNIEPGFIPMICFDKGDNPYDGVVEFCETLKPDATSYTHYFSYGQWSGGTDWGVIINGKHRGQTFYFIIKP